MLPWNLPVVAALLHMVLVMVLIRTGVYRAGGTTWKRATQRFVAELAAIAGPQS